jgi:hypothetical protein
VKVLQHFQGSIQATEPDNVLFRGKGIDSSYSLAYIAPKGSLPTGAITEPQSFYPARRPPPDKQSFLWGWVFYRDQFKGTNPHITEFCQKLTAIGYTTQNMVQPVFTQCHEHNCVDDDCKDYKDITEMAEEWIKKR